MGRKPSRWTNLPRGMRARPRGKLIHYYLDTGEKPRREIPLGSDYVLAVQKWAELANKPIPVAGEGTLPYLIKAYQRDILPTKAQRTREDNEKELEIILEFFGNPPAPLDKIEPVNIKQYMRWRCKKARDYAEGQNKLRVEAGKPPLPIKDNLGHVRANREKALISHIWNYGREEGFTTRPNPCTGIHSFEEEGRDVSPSDDMLHLVMDAGCLPLRFALRLADITGQRPQDVFDMKETSISGPVPGGLLSVKQGKTNMKLRIQIEGPLAVLLLEIKEFKKTLPIYSLALLVNEKGQPLTREALRSRFDNARERAGIDKALFQFRDLRAKAATETEDTHGNRAAQAMLGHTTELMTSKYVRNKVGKKISPIR